MLTRRFGRFFLPLLKTGDAVMALAAWLAAYGVYRFFYAEEPAAGTIRLEHLVPSLVVSLILLMPVFERFGLHEPRRMKTLGPEMWALGRAILVVWGAVYIITDNLRVLDTPTAVKHWALPIWLALGIGERFTARALLRAVRKRGWNLRHAAIVGTGRLGQRTYYVLKKNLWMGIEPLYFVGDPSSRRTLMGLEVKGPLNSTAGAIAAQPVDIVFVALSGASRDKTDHVLRQLASTSVDIRVVPDLPSLHYLKHEVTLIDDLPIITLTHSPMHGWSGMLKRAFDLVFATAALLAMAFPMLVIAVLIKLTSRGPVFYRQQRASLATEPFTIIKFRTMVPNAEAASGPVWTARNDPRVTPIGRILRYTSLDELPQLLNVIRGDMSLVGPRPERPELVERFRRTIPRYMLRHQARAGLTGLAQVYGLRGQTSLRKRIQYDLHYITNWTFGLDIRILLMTVFGRLFNRHER